MKLSESLKTLQKQSVEHRVVNDVLHVFAVRKRARSMITIRGLAARMKAEGFEEHSDDDYRKVLKLLAEAGFGKLEMDTKGRVVALKDIRVTLQSIGKAVLNEEVKLKGFTPRTKYEKVPTDSANPPVLPQTPASQKKQEITEARNGSRTISMPLNISFDMGAGKPVVITLPKGLSQDEIALLISQFSDNRRKI